MRSSTERLVDKLIQLLDRHGDRATSLQDKTGWQQSGELHTGKPNEVMNCAANFTDPGQYVIQFGITPNPKAVDAGGNPLDTFAEAQVFWSVEGNTISRRVTVGNGTSIAGAGQAVKIKIQDRTVGAFAAFPYTVSAQVTEGTRASTNQPPTLVPIPSTFNQLPAGADPVILVPQDAGVISVYVTAHALLGGVCVPIPDGSALVTQFGKGAPVKQYDFRLGWVPLAPGVQSVALHNDMAAATILWSIAFGIDG